MKDFQFTLTYNSVPKVLKTEPNGWANFQLEYLRDSVYHSVINTITNTLKFTGGGLNDDGGYQFIKDAYNADGIKAEVTLLIEARNPLTNDYDFFYEGLLWFLPEKWGDEIKPKFFEVGLIDSARLQTFIANEDVEIDINSEESLDGTAITGFANSPKECSVDPIDTYLRVELDNSSLFSGTDEELTGTTLTFYTNLNSDPVVDEIGDRLKLEFPATDEQLYSNTLDYKSYFYAKVFSGSSGDNIWIEDAPTTQVWTYEKTIVITVYDADGNFQEWIRQVIHTEAGVGNESGLRVSQDFEFSFNELTVYAGGSITMQTEIELVTGGTGIYKKVSSSTRIDSTIFYERTDGIASYAMLTYLPDELFSRALQITTNETDTSKLFRCEEFGRTDSEFEAYSVDGEYAYYAYLTGFTVRGYTDKSFITTFKNSFTSYDNIFCLTLIYDRVNDIFKIAKRTEAYKNEEIFRLENVADLKIESASDYYYKTIESGYQEQTFSDFGGINEVNLESTHTIDMPVKTGLDVRCLATASSVATELAKRVRYKNSASSDSDFDDLKYILHLDSDLKAIAGVDDLDAWEGAEQYINWSITPRENLIRHGEFIQASLFHHPTQSINKSSYQKESDAEYTNQNGDLVTELSNIEPSELADLRVLPELYILKCTFTTAMVAQLKIDPHGYITVPYEGEEYKGFIISLVGNPSTKLATLTLLRANL